MGNPWERTGDILYIEKDKFMSTNFIRLGDRVVNLANVSYIRIARSREIGLVAEVYFVGSDQCISFSGTEGQALRDWCENSVPQITSAEEEIPMA